MIRIALTGGVAVGKSTALKLLRDLGCATISSDSIVHELMSKNMELKAKLKTAFNCVDTDGKVDRSALSRLVFNDASAKQKLEALTHPLVKIVRKEFFQECAKKNFEFAVCETPLLFEKGLVNEFDYSILLSAGLDVRVDRYINSGQGDQEKFFKITKNQMLDAEKTSKADFVVKNNSSKLQLKTELQKVLEQIRTKQNRH